MWKPESENNSTDPEGEECMVDTESKTKSIVNAESEKIMLDAEIEEIVVNMEAENYVVDPESGNDTQYVSKILDFSVPLCHIHYFYLPFYLPSIKKTSSPFRNKTKNSFCLLFEKRSK